MNSLVQTPIVGTKNRKQSMVEGHPGIIGSQNVLIAEIDGEFL